VRSRWLWERSPTPSASSPTCALSPVSTPPSTASVDSFQHLLTPSEAPSDVEGGWEVQGEPPGVSRIQLGHRPSSAEGTWRVPHAWPCYRRASTQTQSPLTWHTRIGTIAALLVELTTTARFRRNRTRMRSVQLLVLSVATLLGAAVGDRALLREQSRSGWSLGRSPPVVVPEPECPKFTEKDSAEFVPLSCFKYQVLTSDKRKVWLMAHRDLVQNLNTPGKWHLTLHKADGQVALDPASVSFLSKQFKGLRVMPAAGGAKISLRFASSDRSTMDRLRVLLDTYHPETPQLTAPDDEILDSFKRICYRTNERALARKALDVEAYEFPKDPSSEPNADEIHISYDKLMTCWRILFIARDAFLRGPMFVETANLISALYEDLKERDKDVSRVPRNTLRGFLFRTMLVPTIEPLRLPIMSAAQFTEVLPLLQHVRENRRLPSLGFPPHHDIVIFSDSRRPHLVIAWMMFSNSDMWGEASISEDIYKLATYAVQARGATSCFFLTDYRSSSSIESYGGYTWDIVAGFKFGPGGGSKYVEMGPGTYRGDDEDPEDFAQDDDDAISIRSLKRLEQFTEMHENVLLVLDLPMLPAVMAITASHAKHLHKSRQLPRKRDAAIHTLLKYIASEYSARTAGELFHARFDDLTNKRWDTILSFARGA
jgi:hypothetical protein